jgi:hypothetical protein
MAPKPCSGPALNPTATISRPDTIAPMLGIKASRPVMSPSSAAIGTPITSKAIQVNRPSTTIPTIRPNSSRRRVKPTRLEIV